MPLPGRQDTGTRYNRYLKLLASLRIVLIFHTLAVLAQAVFAGQFLSGIDGQVVFHERTAWVVLGASILQIVLAALTARAGGVSLWLVFGSIFVFLGEGLQMGTGYGRFLGVHIPLGVIVFGALMWQIATVFRTPGPTESNRA